MSIPKHPGAAKTYRKQTGRRNVWATRGAQFNPALARKTGPALGTQIPGTGA